MRLLIMKMKVGKKKEKKNKDKDSHFGKTKGEKIEIFGKAKSWSGTCKM